MSENSEGRQIQYNLIGFASADDAKAAGDRVARAIDEISKELGLSLAGLEGVTVAFDYDAALAQLDRGFDGSSPLTRTNDEIGDGCAMAPLVERNGQVMTHLVFNAFIVPLIDSPQSGVSGKYIVAHELSHVHEHYFRDRLLPNILLKVKIAKADDAVLFDVADTCWGEYAACLFSAPIHPEQTKLYEMPLIDLLGKAKNEIIEAKKEWLVNHEVGKLWQRAGTIVLSLLKYFSYLLGHAAGLGKPAHELASGAWALLGSNVWLLPWIKKLDEALGAMMETFEEWKSLEVFAPLQQIARGLLADCGMTLSDSKGSLYVGVGTGKLSV
jgi:hypothetical protein